MVTHQLQVERRTAKAHRPKTDALPLEHATVVDACYTKIGVPDTVTPLTNCVKREGIVENVFEFTFVNDVIRPTCFERTLLCRALLWPPCVADADIIFLPCSFYLLLSSSISFSYSSPNLSGRRLDVYHTSTHGVALVRISNAGLKCAARGSLKIQDAKNRRFGSLEIQVAKMMQKIAIWAPSHNFVGLYLRN